MADMISSYNLLQKGLLAGILVGFALIVLGWILIPATNLLSILGACIILFLYGLVYTFGLPRIHPEILHWSSVFGLIAGTIFAGEILLEYILLPKDNTSWGLVEFGGVFFLYFLSGLWVSYRKHRVRSGILAAALSATMSALIWLIVVLIVFYLFRGTDRQVQVFMAEGNYADFARSGMTDFNTFVMEDFLGAGFFHLSIGPILALLLGAIGGFIGKMIAGIRNR